VTFPNDRSLERIAALLAQAENTDNEAEATVFMEKAQALATAHSIDLAIARAHTKGKERTVPTQRSIRVGERRTRGLGTYVTLFSGIAGANDVKIDIAHDSTVVYAFGFAEDIDLAEQIYTSVLGQMVTASAAFKKKGEWKQDTVTTKVRGYTSDGWYGTRYEEKPVSWLSARLSFQDGYARRIGERLRLARQEAEQQRIAADAAKAPVIVSDDEPGTDLVLANKQVEVKDFYKATSRARGSWRGAYSGNRSHTASSAGRSAADKARLSGRGEIGGRRGELTA
jgi:hypothetical protein